MERILIVGANGWVASRLVSIITELHKETKIFLRGMDITPQKENNLLDDFIQGDITVAEDVKKALDGIDTVFHVVALFQGSESLLKKVNITGVEVVLRSSKQSSTVTRFI